MEMHMKQQAQENSQVQSLEQQQTYVEALRQEDSDGLRTSKRARLAETHAGEAVRFCYTLTDTN